MARTKRPDVEEGRAKMEVPLKGTTYVLEFKTVDSQLLDSETVIRIAGGKLKGGGLLVLTDRRLLFFNRKIGRVHTSDFPLDKVSSVDWKQGMINGTITIFAMGEKSKIEDVYNVDGRHLVEETRERLHAGSSPYPAPSREPARQDSPAQAADPMAAIAQLGQLHDAGVLSDEEFNEKKAELLKRI